jgi:hypothetical protein
MGTFFVGMVLVIVVGLIIFHLVRRYRQGRPVLCDAVECRTCGSQAACQSKHCTINAGVEEEKPVRIVKRIP